MEKQFDYTNVKLYYHVSPEGAEKPVYQTPASTIFEPEVLKETLRISGGTAQADSFALPASFIGTSLCKLVLIQLQFAAQYDRLIDLSPDNLIFQVELHDDHAHLGYRIIEERSVAIPSEQRDRFLIAHWESYFKRYITPGIEAIAAASDLKPDALWQQFGGQLYYLNDYLIANEKRADVIKKFKNDSQQLADLEATLFHRRRNPFQHKPRYIENPFKPEEKWLMQSSCCMYDRRENGIKCYVCPQMTEAEREHRKREMLAAAAQ